MMLFAQASSDEGLSSGIIAHDSLAYTQGNLTSNDIVIIEFLTDDDVSIRHIEPGFDQVSVFPNPVRSSLLNVSSIHNITMINILGQLVKNIPAKGKEIELDISDLTKGIYILNVQTEHGLLSKKVQIVR